MIRRILWVAVVLLAVPAAGAAYERAGPEVGTEVGAASPGRMMDGERVKDWPMFRHDPGHSGYTLELLAPPLELAWTYSTGQPIVSSPAVAKGRVYFGSRDMALHALDATTGKRIWQYRTGGWIDSSPALFGGMVYFASRDGFIYALSRSKGTLRWRCHTGGRDCSSPVLAKGKVYVGSAFPNTHIFALNSHTGKLVWRYSTSQPVYSSPVVGGEVVYSGSNDGVLYALSPREVSEQAPPSVRPRWTFSTEGGFYFSSPSMSDSLVYCVPGNYDRNIYCVRLSDGSVKWQYEVQNTKVSAEWGPDPSWGAGSRVEGLHSRFELYGRAFPFVYVSSPALAHGLVYFVSGYPEQSVYALDGLDGSLRWSGRIGRAIELGYSSSPVVAGSVLWVGSGDGVIHAFDALSGSPLWSHSLKSPIVSSPAVANGKLWVATWGGDLHCFRSAGERLTSVGGGSAEFTSGLPATYALLPPVPNPLTSHTTIRYTLPREAGEEGSGGGEGQRINLSVFDLTGRFVRNLVDGPMKPGCHTVGWDGSDSFGREVASGVYFCKLQAGQFESVRKMVVLR